MDAPGSAGDGRQEVQVTAVGRQESRNKWLCVVCDVLCDAETRPSPFLVCSHCHSTALPLVLSTTLCVAEPGSVAAGALRGVGVGD